MTSMIAVSSVTFKRQNHGQWLELYNLRSGNLVTQRYRFNSTESRIENGEWRMEKMNGNCTQRSTARTEGLRSLMTVYNLLAKLLPLNIPTSTLHSSPHQFQIWTDFFVRIADDDDDEDDVIIVIKLAIIIINRYCGSCYYCCYPLTIILLSCLYEGYGYYLYCYSYSVIEGSTVIIVITVITVIVIIVKVKYWPIRK